MRSIPTTSVSAHEPRKNNSSGNRSPEGSGGSAGCFEPALPGMELAGAGAGGGRTAGTQDRSREAGSGSADGGVPGGWGPDGRAGAGGREGQGRSGSREAGSGGSAGNRSVQRNGRVDLGTKRGQRFRGSDRNHNGNARSRRRARAEARDERGKGRATARRITTLDRVRKCGTPFPHGAAFKVGSAGNVSVAGLSTCGSVWACPVCAHRIAVKRAMDLGRGIARWVSAGNSVVMVTFTVRHDRDDALEDVWNALMTAQRRVVSGRAWKRDQADFAIAGYHRTTECTLSWENGWHVHFHVLYFIEQRLLTAIERASLKVRLFERWTAGLRRAGFDAGWEHGIDVRAMKLENLAAHEGDIEKAMLENPSLADYLAKSGARSAAQLADGRRLALEALAHTGKTSQGGYTPFALLGMVRELEDMMSMNAKLGVASSAKLRKMWGWAKAHWEEWETFSLNRRQVTMSREDKRTGKKGLVKLLKLKDADVDDDVLAQDASVDDAEVVAVMPAESVRKLISGGKCVESLGAVLEAQGMSALQLTCTTLGVELLTDDAALGLWEFEEQRMRYLERKP
ncbi:protein rep [Gordonia sp. w5E2]|uniref:Putative replication protein n=2 Tax=Gordonia TaxID=2053 RepID=L7KLX9_9ACTN|nr:protein rep [Gordonia aichiensis]OBC09383.1 replication protein [Gordonia sp. 852002-50816_SCH5313054-a]OBC13186.1 replication protein [Gordonia sp. 852002-50816_SCH5313054-c]GAC48723.1 putative replication protein [Gordonia aichiensis NBRC 108223]